MNEVKVTAGGAIESEASQRSAEAQSPAGGLGTEIAGLFRDYGLEQDIPELRGHAIEPDPLS